MKSKTVFYLAGYIMLMGIIGNLRTGAMMPVYLNGSIAIVTSILGLVYFKSGKAGLYILNGWLVLNFLMYTYMTLFGAKAHPNPTVGTYLIFGSMALFCLMTVVELRMKTR